MAYIYKIKNTENNMLYVGKTTYSLEDRFEGHINDSKDERRKHRKLYIAMNEIGIDKFSIELIEEVDNDIASIREMYWIEKLDTYNNGYNSTLGGDGKSFYDYDYIVEEYLKIGCINDLSISLKIDKCTIKKILDAKGIKIKNNSEVLTKKYGVAVNMHDKNTKEILRTFPSRAEASRYVLKLKNRDGESTSGLRSHIKQVCEGRRKSAGGFFWSIA